MGKIQRFKNRTVIRLSVEEVLTAKMAASQNVIFTLAEMISKFAQMKAEEKEVALPGGVSATSFDPRSAEFIVTFSSDIESVMQD